MKYRTKEENDKICYELYSMNLLEWKNIKADDVKIIVTRVPGGWIFENYNEGARCFVPYSNEFLPTLK
jgi:hypothetical protein